LLKVIYSLHHHQAARFGGEPIILGVRKAAEILSIDKNDAHKMLKCLENDGVIELVTRGIGHRASRWRWIWPTDHGVIRKND
ncbi:hypothetical protein, partial [Undibacterium luofuense]|uniref:hypothetical protein n=1 Tax=Undibacterium luofuense TaxID=2828733 RepID=UPI0030EF10D5